MSNLLFLSILELILVAFLEIPVSMLSIQLFCLILMTVADSTVLYHNGSVFSKEGPPDCWILIKDGKVAARGNSADQIKNINLAENNVAEVDLQGKLLTPGRRDK